MSRLDDQMREPLQHPLDAELRSALHREEPPVGFEARLMARLASQPKRESVLARWFPLPLFRFPAMTRVAFAGVLCLMLLAGVQYEHGRRERVEGEAAKTKLMQALRVAGTELQAVRAKVLESSGDGSETE